MQRLSLAPTAFHPTLSTRMENAWKSSNFIPLRYSHPSLDAELPLRAKELQINKGGKLPPAIIRHRSHAGLSMARAGTPCSGSNNACRGFRRSVLLGVRIHSKPCSALGQLMAHGHGGILRRPLPAWNSLAWPGVNRVVGLGIELCLKKFLIVWLFYSRGSLFAGCPLCWQAIQFNEANMSTHALKANGCV